MLRCYSHALGQHSSSNDLGTWQDFKGREESWVATQDYPKVRAKVLIRHKRLYLVCTDETRTLFMLPRASVCKQRRRAQDKAGKRVDSRRTITCPKTIVYVLAMIRVKVHEARRDNKT